MSYFYDSILDKLNCLCILVVKYWSSFNLMIIVGIMTTSMCQINKPWNTQVSKIVPLPGAWFSPAYFTVGSFNCDFKSGGWGFILNTVQSSCCEYVTLFEVWIEDVEMEMWKYMFLAIFAVNMNVISHSLIWMSW